MKRLAVRDSRREAMSFHKRVGVPKTISPQSRPPSPTDVAKAMADQEATARQAKEAEKEKGLAR